MLPPSNRLRKEIDIKRVLARGKSCGSGLLICKTAVNGLTAARFCFVISKKISNKAVIRNKLKRRLRHVVREFLPQIKQNADYVFIARSGLQMKTFDELRCIMNKALVVSGAVDKNVKHLA